MNTDRQTNRQLTRASNSLNTLETVDANSSLEPHGNAACAETIFETLAFVCLKSIFWRDYWAKSKAVHRQR